jgi:two-component system, OmpR family, response regulator
MRILVVEDDERLGQLLQRALRSEGHPTDLVTEGDEALVLAAATAYDVIILDVMLPGLDGFEVCRRLRAEEVWTSVLLLTAREDVESRVAGLDAGADDYLVKPFSLDELLARLRALTRRGPGRRPVVLEAGGLRLDTARHVVMRGNTAIELSPKELALLETLMRREGEVVSRFDLLEAAWDDSYEHRSNVIDVHLRNLREKIDRPFGTATIETIRGAGYRLCP